MSARDKAIAAALAGARPGTFAPNYMDRHTAWKNAVLAVSDACADSKRGFRRAEFLAACGLTVLQGPK